VVLIPNVLFQAENKYAMIEEGVRILKSGGQLLIVDWFKDAPFGPKEGTITPEEIKKALNGSGFSLKKELAAGDYHYALLFVK
jgi:ubiquinone/menaquinone biosynthesis C-methylase UbiE